MIALGMMGRDELPDSYVQIASGTGLSSMGALNGTCRDMSPAQSRDLAE